MQMTYGLRRLRAAFEALDARLSRFRLLIGAAAALLLGGGFALLSVYAGPLYNLNDIGGFSNRVIFIAMTAAVFVLLELAAAALSRGSIYRMLLRQMIVAAGMLILLTGINQKTFFYVERMQPLVRAMDGAGLSALTGWETNLTAPAATLLYLITRGPVYDMYSVKLLCVSCCLLLCLLVVHLADRRRMGIRSEALLCLCVILPQGFISAGCTPLLDTVCLALLGVSLLLVLNEKRGRAGMYAGTALYGLALAMSGLALYALPVYMHQAMKKGVPLRALLCAPAVVLLACVPALSCGVPAAQVFASLHSAVLGLPEYAAGAPGMMSLIPRAEVAEMPIIWWMDRLPSYDAVTNAQPYYTQAHFEIAAIGFAVAGIAIYAGVYAWLSRRWDMTSDERAYALVLTALIVCPGATNAAWLAASLLSLYLLFADRRLRLSACMVLFAASCSAVYPMTREVLLPMAAAFVLCLCALLMTLGVIPTSLRLTQSEE